MFTQENVTRFVTQLWRLHQPGHQGSVLWQLVSKLSPITLQSCPSLRIQTFPTYFPKKTGNRGQIQLISVQKEISKYAWVYMSQQNFCAIVCVSLNCCGCNQIQIYSNKIKWGCDVSGYSHMMLRISEFRTGLTKVATYGHIPVPLVYTQVIPWIIYFELG